MKVLRLVAINVLVFVGLLSVCFLGIELWSRMQPRNMFIEFDPILGFRLKPNVEGLYRGLSVIHPNPHIRTSVRINSLGLRGPEITLPKPAGTRRVLLVGDSFVEAFEVPYEDTFYSRLEKKAQASGGNPVQFVSMGVMGYGTAQELLWLREHGRSLRPDIVLLVLFLGNDVVDNSHKLNFSGARPYFDLQGDQLQLVALPNSINRYKYWAAEHIRSFLLYKELGSRLSGVRGILQRFSLDNNPGRAGGQRGAGRDLKISQAFELTFALIKAMRHSTAEMESSFAVAYYGDYPTGGSENAESLMAGFCAKEKIPCLNLNPYLTNDPRNVVPNDGHWSIDGHRIVADVIWHEWRHLLVEPVSRQNVASVSQQIVALARKAN